MIDRVPPHDVDAEESVLSALFVNNSGFEEIDSLCPDDFYKGANQKIFSAMISLRKKGEPVDLVTVASELKKKNEFESIGGASYLAKISDSAPVATNIRKYAGLIMEYSKAREMIRTAMEIIDNGFSVNNIDEYISTSQAKILQVQTTSAIDKFYSLDQLVCDAVDRIDQIQQSNFKPGLNFGFPVLGSAMHICGSKLIILAARPGMGKTALMLSIAKYLGCQGVKNTIISIEMDRDALTDRFLSEESDINSLCFYSPGSISKKSKENLEIAASRLSRLPIFIDDSECRIEDVERKCRKAKKMGSQIIFIDQLSKIAFPSHLSEFQGYTRNCNRIALLKKELRIPIVLLCQLNRNVEDRPVKRPKLSDLKQTGAIEEDADMIFFIYRPGYYEKLENPSNNPDQSRTEIILAKNRNGATGVEQQVLFAAKRGMFNLLPKA